MKLKLKLKVFLLGIFIRVSESIILI